MNNFVEKSNVYFMGMSNFAIKEEPEFMTTKTNFFHGEELASSLHEIYDSLKVTGWQGEHASSNLTKIDHIAYAYLNGFYIPCTERLVFAGQIDLMNDPIPEKCGLIVFEDKKPIFVHVQKAVPPRGVVAFGGHTPLSVTYLYNEDSKHFDKSLSTFTRYVSVAPNGAVIPCVMPQYQQIGKESKMFSAMCRDAAFCVNTNADARFVWHVQTSKDVIGNNGTKIKLGVSEEHVKSLFYAREAPLSAAGRLRPILHWVNSHQRRLEKGIDINIREHLRGIDKFEMGDFGFNITNPNKEFAKEHRVRRNKTYKVSSVAIKEKKETKTDVVKEVLAPTIEPVRIIEPIKAKQHWLMAAWDGLLNLVWRKK